MKTTMKKFIITLGLAMLPLLAAQAQYNRASAETLLAGGTNNVPANSTNTYAINLDVRFQSNVGIGVSAVCSGASTGNLLLFFARSVDGSVFESTPSITVVAPLNGTTTNNSVTVTNTDGVMSLRLVRIANTNSVNITNLLVRYLIKR